MPRRNFILPALALVVLVLFFCFLVRLLLLRYERGDVYPAYSTLRADPLGSRAFFEALASLGSYPASRGFTTLHRELTENPRTLFYLGLDSDSVRAFSKDEVAGLDAYVKNGGRVVITFAPEQPGKWSADSSRKDADKKKDDAKPVNKDTPKPGTKPAPKPDVTPPAQPEADAKPAEPQTQQEKYEREELRKETEEDEKNKDEPPPKYERSLAALWGFGDEDHREDEDKKTHKAGDDASSDSSDDSDSDKKKPEVLAVRTAGVGLESNVPWKSALFFLRLEPEWQVLYTAKTKPVLIRRAWGKGEIIVATDSYLVSNEALRSDRRPALLDLLAGPPGRVLFDETHLGTEEEEDVMFLAKKFHLEGYLFGMFVVLLLYLWRNSVPLVPPRSSGDARLLGGTVSGKDSRSGLVNLLRRNIAPADILKTSLAEWKRNVTPARPHLQGKMAEMESIVAPPENNRGAKIVESYHQLRGINNPRRAKGTYATKS